VKRLFGMGAVIAIISRKGENAAETAVDMLKMLKHDGVEFFGVASPTTVKIEKSIDALEDQNVDSPIVVGHIFSKVFTHDKPQPTKIKDATLVFDGRIFSTKVSGPEIVARKLQNRKEPIRNLTEQFEGCFAFAIAETTKIIAGRDVMGIHPFYYGENTDFAALASERKALWRIGIDTVNSFPPGNVALVDGNGFKFKPVKTLVCSKEKKASMHVAAKRLQKLLRHSIKERISGLKEVAVAFSGGLDSSIVAFLAENLGVDVHLIHVSLENQPETEQAKKAAERLGLPIHFHLCKEEDVERTLPKVLWLIEQSDPIKTSIGIPFYWTAEKAAKMDFRAILAGQGADELFGGYKRYVYDYLTYGREKLSETLFNDVLKMHETNFERDFEICNFHNVELRLPFATYEIAKLAIELPIELKIEMKNNGLRKLVLRRVAENLGLPHFITKRPKKAIQYATGVNRILKRLARTKGVPMKEYIQEEFRTILKKMMENE
jgi:asparagine synthase (glutamine-hydrolysing)